MELFQSMEMLGSKMGSRVSNLGTRERERGFRNKGRHRKREYEDHEKKVMMKMEDSFKNEEKARQRVRKELAVMKDEIKNFRMGSGSTVCSESKHRSGIGIWYFCQATTTHFSLE